MTNRGHVLGLVVSASALLGGIALALRDAGGGLGAAVTDLPKILEEGELVYRQLPFPFRRKPFVPSRLHETAEVRTVPLRLMYASQRGVVEHGVREHMRRRASSDPKDLPLVYAEADGTYTVSDGHHRLTAAYLRGRKTARVRVVQVP